MESLHKLKKMMCRELDEISNKGDERRGFRSSSQTDRHN